ncbi:MAG TPA: hypothetical protein VEW48_02495 [Thermoanaerobaculia bacterium]|nr:hypothetical protein [Thermoanaerobaculia bacterium]
MPRPRASAFGLGPGHVLPARWAGEEGRRRRSGKLGAVVSSESASPAADALDVVIRLRSRRRERAELLQKVQHAIPAGSLLMVGVQGLVQGERGFAPALAVAEVAISALLFRALIKAFRAARSGHGSHEEHAHGVDWVDVFVAGVLAVEAVEHWHTHHHLPRPTVLSAILVLALGLSHGRLNTFAGRKRALRIDGGGIRVGRRFFLRQFVAPWRHRAHRRRRALGVHREAQRPEAADRPGRPAQRRRGSARRSSPRRHACFS